MISRNFFNVFRRNKVEVEHFKTKTSWLSENIDINPPKVSFLISLCLGNMEIVPYTNRSHLVLSSPSCEKQMGKSAFNDIKSELKGKILPPSHPLTIRVSNIAHDIIATVKFPMEGLNWEVIVIDKPKKVNAYYLPGGKIVVFTGLLIHFKSDAEIATIVGHEVGHIVARHTAETITNFLSRKIIQLIFYRFYKSYSRRKEMEADYIELFLMASAGYDPRVAPKVYEQFDEIRGRRSTLKDYTSTHPSGKKRSKRLSQPKVMEEALSIYREAQAGRGGV